MKLSLLKEPYRVLDAIVKTEDDPFVIGTLNIMWPTWIMMDHSICLHVIRSKRSIGNPRRVQPTQVWFGFFLCDAFIKWRKTLWRSFTHAAKWGDYYLIGDRNDDCKHFGVNGLTWDSEPHIKLNFPWRTIMTLNSSVKCHLPSFKQLYSSQSSFLLQFTSW